MLKLLAAELSLRAGKFMPSARAAVVADPAPDAGGRGARGPHGLRSPAPAATSRRGTGRCLVRVRLLALAAGATLLAPTALSDVEPTAWEVPQAHREGDVGAADLLAATRDCAPVSQGRYRTDSGTPATVQVCGARGAVFWTADMDIDCDGRVTPHCNPRTDPDFSAATAYQQSDGRYLSAEELPYIVVPAAGDIWNPRSHGIEGGSVAAVVHQGRVSYAVVGDVGPSDIIGEASYAAAEALGIRPDPHAGGTASGVTYIVFGDTRVAPIEDHAAAVTAGQRRAREFVHGG